MEEPKSKNCLDICILGDLEYGAGDHMLLSAGAVPNLGVVKRHLSAGAHPPPKRTPNWSNRESMAVIKTVQIKTRSELSPSGLERELCKYADQKHV